MSLSFVIDFVVLLLLLLLLMFDDGDGDLRRVVVAVELKILKLDFVDCAGETSSNNHVNKKQQYEERS